MNIEQIVALLADEGRLGGFHFNNRKYADDDLIVGSVNPFELFLIFVELAASGGAAAADDRPGPQRRGQGRGDGAERRQPPGGLRQGAARRPRRAAPPPSRRGDVLGGHEVLLDAYRTDVRPLCAKVARRRWAPPRTRSPRCARPATSARIGRPSEEPPPRWPGAGADERRRRPLIDLVEDRWPAHGRARTTRSGRSCSPPTCSAPTAPWRTSAAATRPPRARATDHVGREVDAMWVKGSGSDLATMGPEHFTRLRLDEMLPLIERAEMSDEDMVAYLARCQLDPAAPRSSIETLLHAFVPAAARAPHAPRRHQRDRGRRGRRAADRRVLRRRGGLDPLHPPGLHARQAGRRGRARQPGR